MHLPKMIALVLIALCGCAPASNQAEQATTASPPHIEASSPHDNFDVATMMITRTMQLYVGEESNWPVKIKVSHSGGLAETICGPTQAGYCKADNTIALSSDFIMAQTSKSHLAVPFIVGHELAHGMIMNNGSPPRHGVLHELLADCIAGQLMGQAFGTLPVEDEKTIKEFAGLTHDIGDPLYFSSDHHGFGSQRYIAFYLGFENGNRRKLGDDTHANDCLVFFYD